MDDSALDERIRAACQAFRARHHPPLSGNPDYFLPLARELVRRHHKYVMRKAEENEWDPRTASVYACDVLATSMALYAAHHPKLLPLWHFGSASKQTLGYFLPRKFALTEEFFKLAGLTRVTDQNNDG